MVSATLIDSISVKTGRTIINQTTNIRSRIIQYFLIYYILLTGNSYLYSYYLDTFTVFFAAVFLAISFFVPKYWRFRDIAFLCFVFTISMVVRCIAGGAGIGTFARYAATIIGISVAISIDQASFLRRLVRVVCFLSLISIVAYFARVAIPGFYYMLPLHEFESQGTHYSMAAAASVNYKTKGLFLLCAREGETRNIGIFTEPGVYQGVLSGTLFCVLFLSRWLEQTSRERTVSAIVLMLAIATCGSTTGLITIAILLFLFFCSSTSDSEVFHPKMKRRVFVIFIGGLGLLIVDFFLRGDSSILVESVIDKLFNSSGDMQVGENGAVRIDSVIASLDLLSVHPFGVGFDAVQAYKGAAAVGAGLFTTTAALGFPFGFAFIYWLFAPIFRSDIGAAAKLSFVFAYLLFAISQSLVLTPVFVAISVFLAIQLEGKAQ